MLVTFDADGGGIVPGRIGSKERFVRMLYAWRFRARKRCWEKAASVEY
jgi:hypothetical protein